MCNASLWWVDGNKWLLGSSPAVRMLWRIWLGKYGTFSEVLFGYLAGKVWNLFRGFVWVLNQPTILVLPLFVLKIVFWVTTQVRISLYSFSLFKFSNTWEWWTPVRFSGNSTEEGPELKLSLVSWLVGLSPDKPLDLCRSQCAYL